MTSSAVVQGIVPTSIEDKGTNSLTTQSKYMAIALAVGAIVGSIMIALGAAHICGSVGSTGFIGSIAAGGLVILISGGGLIALAIANCKSSKREEDFSKNPLYQKWYALQTDRKGRLCYTHTPKYAIDFAKELTRYNVSTEGYKKLIVWHAVTRTTPGVFQGGWTENIACDMDPQTFEKGTILLITVIPHGWDFEEAKQSIFQFERIRNAWGPNFPVVLHFVKVQKSFFDEEPKVALSPQQCQQIAQHQGECPPHKLSK